MSRPVFSAFSESPHGRIRKLPIRTPPIHGESYASYVDRLAADIHARTSAVLYALGIIDEESDHAIGSGYGIALDPSRMELMATALELPLERVQQMFLSYYNGRAIDLTGLDPLDRSSARKIAVREWAYFSGTHACPDCLGESGGAWQLRWKLPWSFACVRHGRLLADRCPECDRRIGQARQDGSSRPRFISRVPVPGYCANAQPPGVAGAGRAAVPCGYPIHEIDTDPVAKSGRLLNAQKVIDRVLDTDTVRTLGEEIASLDYFRELRSLCSFLLSVVEVSDLTGVPPSVKSAVRLHVETRDDIREDRRVSDKNWRHARRQRHYTGVSDSAALMAGVLPTAVELLAKPSGADLSESLGEYLERFRSLRSGSREHLGYFGFTTRLDAAVDGYMARYQKTTTRLGMRRVRGYSSPSSAYGDMTADHIPQLFWREDFERDLRPLLILSDPRYSRRVCSMWAVKTLTRCDWNDAARKLELPVEQTVGLKTRLLHNLNRDGNTEEFDSRIRAVLSRVGADSGRVDYRARREALAGLVAIGWSDWKEICRKAGVAFGKGDGKNRQAAAWLWSELTSSDHLLSPTYLLKDTENEREYYRRFLKRELPELEDFLRNYGSELLDSSSTAAFI